jgi:hypothetical protein
MQLTVRSTPGNSGSESALQHASGKYEGGDGRLPVGLAPSG